VVRPSTWQRPTRPSITRPSITRPSREEPE
jgi:hypothetical protein